MRCHPVRSGLKRARLVTFLAVLFTFVGPAMPGRAGEEFDGLVVKQVQTRIGHEFHRLFVNNWEPLPGMEKFRIRISERASARWGSLVLISVDERIVQRYQVGVRTGGAMEDIVRQSVRDLNIFLWQLTSLEGEGLESDLAGDGI